MTPTPRPGPSRRTRAGLALGVLLVHGLLLAPPDLLAWRGTDGANAGPVAPVPVATAATAAGPSPASAPAAPLLGLTRVRWIPAPEASAPARPAAPTPQRRATAPTRRPAPAPAQDTARKPPEPNPPVDGPLAQAPVVAEPPVPATDAPLSPPPTNPPDAASTPQPLPAETGTAAAGSGPAEPAPPPVAAADAPAAPVGPHRLAASRVLRYDVQAQVRGVNLSAQGEIRWQQGDGRYLAEYSVRSFLGGRSQRSEGLLVPEGLQPQRFADKSRSERAAHFEPAQGRIRFSNNAPDAAWLAGTQDRLSVFFQLGAWLNVQQGLVQEGRPLLVPVAGTGGRDTWVLTVEGRQTLQLPAGPIQARRVLVAPQRAGEQRIELWLAPELEHLPVRIRMTQPNGDAVDQVLNALP